MGVRREGGSLTPLTIVLIYVMIGGLWIAFSDRVVVELFRDPVALTRAQTVKGWLYILATALLLYGLIQRHASHLRRAQQEIACREQQYRRIIETAQEGICLLDAACVIRFINARLATMLGYAPAQLLARPIGDVLDDSEREAICERLSRQRVGDTIDVQLRRQDGAVLWALASLSPYPGGDGTPAGLLMMLTDITERQYATAKLREANRALTVLTAINEAIIRTSEEQALLDEVCRLIVEEGGYHMAWVGMAAQDGEQRIHPVAWSGYNADFLKRVHVTWDESEFGMGPTGIAVRTGQHQVVHNILTDPAYAPWRVLAQERGYAATMAMPLKANGTPFGSITLYSTRADAFDEQEQTLLVELANDLAYGITALRTRRARQQVQAELEEERALLASAVDLFPFPIVFLTPQGKVFRANTYSREMLRVQPGQDWKAIHMLTPETRTPIAEERRPYRLAMRGETVAGQEMITVLPDGREVPLLVFAVPVKLRGQSVAMVLGLQDISALKEADRAKDRFLAVLSHELRTPLSNILGWVREARDTPDITEEALQVIQRNAEIQHAMLEDLLDVSRILHGRLILRRAPLDLWRLVEDSVEHVRAHAHDQGISIALHPPVHPLHVVGDSKRLRQVFDNILQNGIKFIEHGGVITVSGRRDDHRAEINICDTGIGIPAEDVPTLFTPFSDVSRKSGGLGLGLILVKGIIELHGGSVHAESAGPGQGSIFTISLPLLPVSGGT
jgi:PAS domain S-box-containing protein